VIGAGNGGSEPSAELVSILAEHRAGFSAGMDDDFNCPAALGAMFLLSGEMNRITAATKPPSDARAATGVRLMREGLLEMGEVLALDLSPRMTGGESEVVPRLMEILIGLRAELRERKEWALSDQIRDGLREVGIVIEDHKDGSSWRKGTP